MTIKVDWYTLEKTIILQKREPGWGWEDFDAAVDEYTSLAQSVDHKVAIIVDCLGAPNPPSSSVLGHYRRADAFKPDNLVLMVVVSTRGFMQTMGKVSNPPSRRSSEFLHFVGSIEEAEKLCREFEIGG